MASPAAHIVHLSGEPGPDNRQVAYRFFMMLRDFFIELDVTVDWSDEEVPRRMRVQASIAGELARAALRVGKAYTGTALRFKGVRRDDCLGGNGLKRFRTHAIHIRYKLGYCPIHWAVFIRALLPSAWLVKVYEIKIKSQLARELVNRYERDLNPKFGAFDATFAPLRVPFTLGQLLQELFVGEFDTSNARLLRSLLDTKQKKRIMANVKCCVRAEKEKNQPLSKGDINSAEPDNRRNSAIFFTRMNDFLTWLFLSWWMRDSTDAAENEEVYNAVTNESKFLIGLQATLLEAPRSRAITHIRFYGWKCQYLGGSIAAYLKHVGAMDRRISRRLPDWSGESWMHEVFFEETALVDTGLVDSNKRQIASIAEQDGEDFPSRSSPNTD
ncbi:Hypothetical predicted protein [Lecanosticta acicola]|uniref:Uncharacterized protein n=1 Tax=Lecanosticta acicola TaxID=111012 RepID=A0AAI8Z9L6_9PEZI|nr:Hypothetical predicted protein [Lecanosticta acicola]